MPVRVEYSVRLLSVAVALQRQIHAHPGQQYRRPISWHPPACVLTSRSSSWRSRSLAACAV